MSSAGRAYERLSRTLCALVALALAAVPIRGLAATPPSGPPDPPAQRAVFFMPAIEMGPVWQSAPNLGRGFLVRTAIDTRFARLDAPFLRVAYDATTAPYEQSLEAGPTLITNAAIHDVMLGGGGRFGSEQVQVVTSVLAGLRVMQTPYIGPELERQSLRVDMTSTRSPVALAALGVELYVVPEAALTVEASVRASMSTDTGAIDAWGGALLFGLSTAL